MTKLFRLKIDTPDPETLKQIKGIKGLDRKLFRSKNRAFEMKERKQKQFPNLEIDVVEVQDKDSSLNPPLEQLG